MKTRNYSPLRYPGGKAKLLPFIVDLIKNNLKSCKNIIYIEPYAGGAAVALGLLLDGHVAEVYINDADPAIYCFWENVIKHCKKFINKIKNTDVSVSEWEKQSKIYHENKYANEKQRFELGFAAFYLNRCNHSGVLKGGIIGGKQQLGKYTIDCRYNKEELIRKMMRIYAKKKFIHISCMDAAEWLKSDKIRQLISHGAVLYLDPPYYIKGKQLYKNSYTHEDHKKIAKTMRTIRGNWIVSYDDVPAIRELYKWVSSPNILELNLQYSLSHTNDKGKEVLFVSKNIKHIPYIKESD